MVKYPTDKKIGVWGRISAPQVDSGERDLGNSTFPILHLEISSGCESAGFQLGALGLQKFLRLPKNVRIPKYSYLQALLEKTCYRYMVNSKIIRIWTYLKANRRIHGTLYNLPKHPPSVDSGNWLTAG